MNSKTMAIAAAFVMLAAALSVTMFLPSAGAEDVTSFELGEKEVTLTPDGKGSLLFNVSEAEYINLGYTINWYIALDVGSGSAHSATFNESSKLGSRTVNAGTSVDDVAEFSPDADGVTLDGYVFKIQAMDDLGTYLLTIDANNPMDGCKGIVKCEVIVNSGNGTITIPNNYGFVTVKDNASSPVPLNAMTFTVGEADAFTVSGSSVTVEGNSWYAIGLPEGLSMSPNGVVSGMPTGNDASGSKISNYNDPISVDVYSTTNDGKISTYTLSVKINEAASANMTLSLNSASTTLVVSGTTYTAIQGTNDIKLTITPAVASTLEWASVTVIDTNGQVQVDYDLADGAKIPSDGIGSYKIVVNAIIDSKHVTDSLTLNVISPMDSIEAGIIVSGA